MSEPASSAQLLQQGLFHHRAGDLAAAMQRYVEALQIDPQNADALYYVAVVACQDGQYKEGVKLARRAIEFGPPQARVYNLLGQALHRLLLHATSKWVFASLYTQPLEATVTRALIRDRLALLGNPQVLMQFGYVRTTHPTARRPASEITGT